MVYMVFANCDVLFLLNDMVICFFGGLADVRDMPLPPGLAVALSKSYVTFAWSLGPAAVVVKAGSAEVTPVTRYPVAKSLIG
jgi:hypothetical protein